MNPRAGQLNSDVFNAELFNEVQATYVAPVTAPPAPPVTIFKVGRKGFSDLNKFVDKTPWRDTTGTNVTINIAPSGTPASTPITYDQVGLAYDQVGITFDNK